MLADIRALRAVVDQGVEVHGSGVILHSMGNFRD